MPDPRLRPLRDEADLRELLDEEVAVVYKHSPACFGSMLARRQVGKFAGTSPGTPVGTLDVLRDPPLSKLVEERYGIRHESPQVIVFRNGRPVFDTSHMGVRRSVLRRAVEEVASAPSRTP